MAFIKTGDAQPIQNIYEDDGAIMICPVCNLNKTVVAFKEDGDIETTCQCSILNDEVE